VTGKNCAFLPEHTSLLACSSFVFSAWAKQVGLQASSVAGALSHLKRSGCNGCDIATGGGQQRIFCGSRHNRIDTRRGHPTLTAHNSHPSSV